MKFEKIIENNRNILLFFVFVSFITFYKSIFFAFIHDDWGSLEQMNNASFLEFIKTYTDPQTVLLRILLPAYSWVLYKLFGLNTVMYHIIDLLINSFNAVLVFLLSDKILKNRLSAFAVGFMYASATFHSESVSWALHPPDDLCMIFFLMSFLFYIKEKYLSSTLFFFASLLTKEASVFLPIVLFFYNFIYTDAGKNIIEKIKTCLWRAKYHFTVLFVFLSVRFLLSPNASLPHSHPYKIKFLGIHVIENALNYLKYILTEIIPTSLYYARHLLELSFFQEILVILGIIAIFLVLFFRKPGNSLDNSIDWKLVLFCILFLIAGLAPVIFLPNHNYEYYLTLPSISFLILIVYFIQKLLDLLNLSPNKQKAWLVCYLVFHFILSSISYNYIYAKQSSQAEQNEMSGKLHKYMMRNYPTLSRDSIVIIKGINIFSINRSSALRVWYQDNSLEVYDFNDLVYEDGKYFIRNPLRTQREAFTGERVNMKIGLKKGKTIILEYKDGNYIDITYKYFG